MALSISLLHSWLFAYVLDENGELALDCPTWQFNFRFNLQEDMYAQDSIELLQRSGIDFELHAAHGIDVNVFGELFMSSGLVLNEDVTWVSFHSGYDFGYLLKLLTAARLPGKTGCGAL
jgi:CCR4-NOT transcription complex subunit 7/8